MSDDPLALLHEELAQDLLRRVKSGEASASELSVAVKFLKDNGIEARAVDNSPLANLAKTVPVQFDVGSEPFIN